MCVCVCVCACVCVRVCVCVCACVHVVNLQILHLQWGMVAVVLGVEVAGSPHLALRMVWASGWDQQGRGCGTDL